MCYVIAKHKDKVGSFALKTTHGEGLVRLKTSILNRVGYENVQLVTISRPSAYGEYEPYTFVSTEQEFISAAVSLNN